MGEHGWGWAERGGGRGGGVHDHCPKTPPKANPDPPPISQTKTKVFFRAVQRKRQQGDPSSQKAETPPHHHHRTALRRPSPPSNPPTPPRPPPQNPPPPRPRPTPIRVPRRRTTVLRIRSSGRSSLPYLKGVERGTVRGIDGRKYGALWVEYPGGTTLYEVNRSLLYPSPQ